MYIFLKKTFPRLKFITPLPPETQYFLGVYSLNGGKLNINDLLIKFNEDEIFMLLNLLNLINS